MPLSREESDRLIVEFWPMLPDLVAGFPHFSRRIDDPVGVASVGLVEAGRTFDPSRCQFFTWVYRKVRSALRDEFLKTTAEKRASIPTVSLAIDLGKDCERLAAVDRADAVLAAVAHFCPVQAEAVRLKLTGKYIDTEIGPMLGRSVNYFPCIMRDLRARRLRAIKSPAAA